MSNKVVWVVLGGVALAVVVASVYALKKSKSAVPTGLAFGASPAETAFEAWGDIIPDSFKAQCDAVGGTVGAGINGNQTCLVPIGEATENGQFPVAVDSAGKSTVCGEGIMVPIGYTRAVDCDAIGGLPKLSNVNPDSKILCSARVCPWASISDPSVASYLAMPSEACASGGTPYSIQLPGVSVSNCARISGTPVMIAIPGTPGFTPGCSIDFCSRNK